MNKTYISDAEAHNLVIQQIKSMTREEAQAWLDEVKEVFDRQEAIEQAYRNNLHAKAKTAAKSPREATKVVSG